MIPYTVISPWTRLRLRAIGVLLVFLLVGLAIVGGTLVGVVALAEWLLR